MSKDAVLVGVHVLREMGLLQVAVLVVLGPGSLSVLDVEVVDVFGLPSSATPSGLRFLVSLAVLGRGPCRGAVGRVGFRASQMGSHCMGLPGKMRACALFSWVFVSFTVPLGYTILLPSAKAAQPRAANTISQGGMKHTYGGEFSGLYFMCSLYIDGCDWFPSSAAGALAADASAAGTSESGGHTIRRFNLFCLFLGPRGPLRVPSFVRPSVRLSAPKI